MAYTVNFNISPGLKALLGSDANKAVGGMVNEAALKCENIIKQPGYAPRGEKQSTLKGFGAGGGGLAAGHRVIGSGLTRRIVNNVEYVKYVLSGHRVLTTPRSRRWWFWYLNTQLGGQYSRKTSGGRGYVPPNNYPGRAVVALTRGNALGMIERKWTNKFLHGGK